MKQLLLLLLLPACLQAQEVTPVISPDYLMLIKDSLLQNRLPADTSNSMQKASLQWPGQYNGLQVRKIKIRQGYLTITPAISRMLLVTGNFNTTVEVKHMNQLPALQNHFVQGQSQNGTLVWQGPETGMLFSYGPDIATLEFDGSHYAYDVNGKLVAAGTGNGKPAGAYNNNTIFRTAAAFSQSFNIQGTYLVSGKQVLRSFVKLGQTNENTFIRNNKNKSQRFSVSLETAVKWLGITGSFSSAQDRLSNANRNGFLNRVYQQSLLSPISFDNSQGSNLGVQQRSYSYAADNPFFLLENNGNALLQTNQVAGIILERKPAYGVGVQFKITQAIGNTHQDSREGYKLGTAFFPGGIAVNRQKKDAVYSFKGEASYKIPFYDYHFQSFVKANYNYTNNRSGIDYKPGNSYRYQRSANDVSLSFLTNYDQEGVETGLNLSNKIYASNTTTANRFFLPAAAGFIRFINPFATNAVTIKLVTGFNSTASELPISTSFSQSNLLQYTTQQALQYFPVTEVAGFDNLLPILQREWTGRIELNYKNKASLQAAIFSRKTIDDIFPVFENGQLLLKNIATHRNNGLELELSVNSSVKRILFRNSISFFTNQIKVTAVKAGYNFTPLAGFSNVHTVIVEGAAPGSITGTTYVRDANNNRVIGNDGYPLVNTTPAVIGNPLPRFVMKMSHVMDWKSLSLNLDWEWKNGGQVWNGTQAVLDYYGRSATTGMLRNTTNYIFEGVLQDKRPNNIPVNFYDAKLPVDNNRWTRYGQAGIGEEYIQKADYVRINTLSLSYKVRMRQYLQQLVFTVYANNIMLWTAYKGVDPNQLLYDQPTAAGLDFFNLPAVKIIGFNISVQF